MLDIVGGGELPPGHQVVQCQKKQHQPAECGDQAALQHGGDGIRLQHRVVPAPDRLPGVLQVLRLQLPGAAHAAGQLAQRKAVDALAHAGAGVVLGRGHPAVVAAAVLHREVAVGRHRQHQPGQPLLDRVVLVAQLVGGVQAQAGVATGNKSQHQHRPP